MASNPLASSKAPKIIAAGCLSVIGLVMLVALTVWLNLDALRDQEWFRSATEGGAEVRRLMRLQSTLLAGYPADSVSLRFSQQHDGDEVVHILNATFVNPKFPLVDADGSEEGKAREIALEIVAVYPPDGTYGAVRVSFAKLKLLALKVDHAASHHFDVADLLAELGIEPAGTDDDGDDGDDDDARNPATLPSP
jgi:hypothetical protein